MVRGHEMSLRMWRAASTELGGGLIPSLGFDGACRWLHLPPSISMEKQTLPSPFLGEEKQYRMVSRYRGNSSL